MLGKRKKQISRLLAVAMIIVALSGCGSAKGKTGTTGATIAPRVKLSFLVANDGNSNNVMVEKFKKPFELKYSNIEVNLNFIDTKQLFDKLQANLAANEGPDIVAIDSLITLSKLAGSNSLIGLDDMAKQNNISFGDYDPDIIQAIRDTVGDGKVYMMPNLLLVDMLAYNKKMFAQYGVEPPQKGISLEELFYTGMILKEKIKQAGDDKKDIRPFSVWAPGKLYTKIMQAYGQYMYDAKAVKLNYDSEISQKALKYEYSMYANGLALPQPEAKIKGYATAQELFPQGYTPLMLETGWTMSRILEITSKEGAKYRAEDFDVCPWPMFKGDKPARPSLNCTGFGVTRDSKNPKEAFLAVSYLTNEYEKVTASPSNYGLNARNDSRSNTELLKIFPGLQGALDIQAAKLPDRINDIDKLIDTCIKQNFDQASVGQITYDQLVKKLTDESQKIINEYKAAKK